MDRQKYFMKGVALLEHMSALLFYIRDFKKHTLNKPQYVQISGS